MADTKTRQPIPFRARPPAPNAVPGRERHLGHRASLWLLEGRPLREVAKRCWAHVLDDDLTGRSAQLAYYFFLSLFPGLIFVSSMIGLIAGAQSQLRGHLFDAFATFLPPAAYTLVVTTFAEILKTSTASKALLGIVFAFWSATSGISAMQDALNGVLGIKETRPLWKSYRDAFLLTIVVGALGVVAVVVFFYGPELVEHAGKRFGLNAGLTFVWKLAQWPIAVFVLLFSAAVIYRFAPDLKAPRWRWFTPGSVVGVAGGLTVSGLFRLYLHFFNRYPVTYGSLGAVIILLLWFYLNGFMLLFGAELNHAIEECKRDA